MRCNQSLYASWHEIKEALDIFLGNVPPRSLYARPQSAKSRCWRKLHAREAVIPVIFGRRLAQSCHVWPCIVLPKYDTWSCLKEEQYIGL